MTSLNVRNDELVNMLRGDFQHRGESNFGLVNALAAYMMIPGLRGLWAMTSLDDANPYIKDYSGQARGLTFNGTPRLGYTNLQSYLIFDGLGDYLTRADEAGLDLLGTTAQVVLAQRGVTWGSWVNFDVAAGANRECILAKWNVTGDQRSYEIRREAATGVAVANISSNGTAANVFAASGSIATIASQWYFVCGRFQPSTEVALFANDVSAYSDLQKYVNVTGIPAAIFNSTASLTVARRTNAADYLDGNVGISFISCAYLSDDFIETLFEISKALFDI